MTMDNIFGTVLPSMTTAFRWSQTVSSGLAETAAATKMATKTSLMMSKMESDTEARCDGIATSLKVKLKRKMLNTRAELAGQQGNKVGRTLPNYLKSPPKFSYFRCVDFSSAHGSQETFPNINKKKEEFHTYSNYCRFLFQQLQISKGVNKIF